jgi:hypothetical protein
MHLLLEFTKRNFSLSTGCCANDVGHWQRATSKLRISVETLKHIRPKQVVAVQLRKDGMADPPFGNVVVG